MLLKRYEPLLFNANFTETSSNGQYVAYRGELVLRDGEGADAQGRRIHVPPTISPRPGRGGNYRRPGPPQAADRSAQASGRAG